MEAELQQLATLLEVEAEKLAPLSSKQDAWVKALRQLAEQAVRSGIDYRTLGVGWHHPATRLGYRSSHRSITCPASRKRAEESRQRLLRLVEEGSSGRVSGEDAERKLVDAFLLEIGASSKVAEAATFRGVCDALEAELVLPLRALNEAELARTMQGQPLPKEAMRGKIQELTRAALGGPGAFRRWRYGSAAGAEQLRGLSEEQVKSWQKPTCLEHTRSTGRFFTHEDRSELGFFWATKIGGPSHGFDFETQCILPLLANARHKVILLSDPAFQHHPVGRAHWRLLWSVGPYPDGAPGAAGSPEPRLWLEAVNADFEASVQTDGWEVAFLIHAMSKADAMNVPLSVDPGLADLLQRIIDHHACSHDVVEVSERILLRPSHAIVEASDYLSYEHDWVQEDEEITHPIARALYLPGRKRHLEE
ncbi:unnamed protein product [Effrenium voratum]|uniref:Uncharacterized protein n=1 Tax=Effrenium voratum TaxID=2562239 RepID=A0AA36MY88_9DINO|nr:unnamed protein product [Effrenium voratum]